MAAGGQLAAAETDAGGGQGFAARADRAGFDFQRVACFGADDGQGKAAGIAQHRQQAKRGMLGREHGRSAIALHRLAQHRALVVLQPVAQPVEGRLGGELQTSQRRGGLGAVARPGLRLQFLGDARGFAFIQKSRGRIARGGNDGDGPPLRAVQQVGDQVLALLPNSWPRSSHCPR